MPTKNVSYVQQPVLATDLVNLHFDRNGTGYNASITYEVRDASAVRFTKTVSQAVAAWPTSLVAILAAINTAEGT
jgi:hypothetical protein